MAGLWQIGIVGANEMHSDLRLFFKLSTKKKYMKGSCPVPAMGHQFTMLTPSVRQSCSLVGLSREQSCLSADICQCLETFFVATIWRGRRWGRGVEAGTLLNILQRIGLTPATKNYLSPMSIVLRLRQPTLASCHLKRLHWKPSSSLIHLLSKSVPHRFKLHVTAGKIPMLVLSH